MKPSVQLSTIVLIKLLTGDRTPSVYNNSLSSTCMMIEFCYLESSILQSSG